MTKEERSKLFSHLGVEIPRDQHDKIRAIAKSKQITVSQLVRRALYEYLQKL